MNATTNPPTFTRRQRNDLRLKYGLLSVQIDALGRTLLKVRAMNAKSPAMDDIRSALAEFDKTAKALLKATTLLARAKDGTASDAAREHLEAALHGAGIADDMDDLLLRLVPLASASQSALSGLLLQRRSTLKQNPLPVGLIVDALRSAPGGTPLQVTHTSGSPFRAIVDICYDAAGVAVNAERSIRAYQKSRGSSGTVHRKKSRELSH